MDILFICRDALGSSIMTNLALAIQAKNSGSDVAVLFTEEALQGLTDGILRWPPELLGQEIRYKMADNAVDAGMTKASGGGQARHIDPRASLVEARQKGVPMFASPIWVTLLGLSDKLPGELSKVSPADELKMLKEAKTIIGSL
ncbi:hypothetical protein ACFLUU_06930 [Chloroflexota bacterium]